MVPEDVSHLCVCWTCHIWSLRSWNRHHHWIHIEKWFSKMYHTCVCQTCHIWLLWSSPLNSHQKKVPEDDEDSMGTVQGLHKDCTRTPWTPQGLHKTLKGLSGLLSRLCKVHEESMRSPWERVGDCKIQKIGTSQSAWTGMEYTSCSEMIVNDALKYYRLELNPQTTQNQE